MEWDKEKQKADQLSADINKLTEEKTQLMTQAEQFKTQFETATSRNDELAAMLEEQQAKMHELEAKVNVKQATDIELPKVDIENEGVEGILKQNQFLMDQIKEIRAKNATYEMIVKEYQQEKQQTVAERAKNEAQEAVLRRLDNEYGAEHRNKAVKLATKWVEEGKESQPADKLEAYLLCKKAYQELSKEPEKPKSVPTDTGRDSIPVNFDDNVGEGSIDSVLSKMKKSGKFAGATLPEI